jgi:hypothetical protein
MKKGVDGLGHRRRDVVDQLEIGQPRPADRLDRKSVV